MNFVVSIRATYLPQRSVLGCRALKTGHGRIVSVLRGFKKKLHVRMLRVTDNIKVRQTTEK
jgi:hypothetical protein